MEVPKTPAVYNGAQRCGAVASDIEVVPDTDDEERRHAHAQGSTMADRYAMSDDVDFDFEDEVSGQPVVNVVARSCDAVKGKGASEHALVPNDGAYQRVPVTAQQQYSSRHCRQSDSEPLASQSGTMYRRRRRIHDSGRRGMGEQRRLFEDLRAELTDALRFQQAMFLNARDDIAAQQNEAIEGLRGDMLRIVNEHRQGQPPLAQVGVLEFHPHCRQRCANPKGSVRLATRQLQLVQWSRRRMTARQHGLMALAFSPHRRQRCANLEMSVSLVPRQLWYS